MKWLFSRLIKSWKSTLAGVLILGSFILMSLQVITASEFGIVCSTIGGYLLVHQDAKPEVKPDQLPM